jgi:hypothetical protein
MSHSSLLVSINLNSRRTLLYELFRLQVSVVITKRQVNRDWNYVGWFIIKANVNVKDSTRGDQRNLEELGAPSNRRHWPAALTRGSEVSRTPGCFKSNVQISCYNFLSDSLWDLPSKDKGVAWSRVLLFPSLCGHGILQRDDPIRTENKPQNPKRQKTTSWIPNKSSSCPATCF